MDDTRVLLELLRGRGAHTDSLACLAGLGAPLAAREVPGSPHTVWGIVLHMNYWMDYEVRRIEGHPPAYPEAAALSWPAVPEGARPAAWDDAVATFARHLEALTGFVANPGLLERALPAVHASEATVDTTVHGILWQMVAHNSYHLGQVALLRRSLGAWPPPGGSDTW
jgi:uncharacterized damage-inducible protein DinB